jgi:hypothetical protein
LNAKRLAIDAPVFTHEVIVDLGWLRVSLNTPKSTETRKVAKDFAGLESEILN